MMQDTLFFPFADEKTENKEVKLSGCYSQFEQL